MVWTYGIQLNLYLGAISGQLDRYTDPAIYFQYERPSIEHLLKHHSTQMVSGNMPPTTMNANDLRSVVPYIRSMPSTP